MDRVHRIGQKRAVRATRFIMEDSLEERMIKLQNAKAALGKGSLQKLTPEERKRVRSLLACLSLPDNDFLSHLLACLLSYRPASLH